MSKVGAPGPAPNLQNEVFNPGSQNQNLSQASQERLQPLSLGGDCHGMPKRLSE